VSSSEQETEKTDPKKFQEGVYTKFETFLKDKEQKLKALHEQVR